MSRNYSREFKEALVTQLLTRGERTIASVCALSITHKSVPF